MIVAETIASGGGTYETTKCYLIQIGAITEYDAGWYAQNCLGAGNGAGNRGLGHP